MDYKYINTDYLDSVSSGDIEIIRELVDMFRDQVTEAGALMRKLLSDKDYTSLGLLAHKTKSSVLIMGMNDLGVMLKTFELQAREGTATENYDSYIEKFSNDTSEALKELDYLVNNRINQK